MKAIKFNTGRQYTPEGQVIVAWVHSKTEDEFGDSYVIRFFDVSRGITGEISWSPDFNQVAVMRAYDVGSYKCVSYMPGVEEEKAEALALTA